MTIVTNLPKVHEFQGTTIDHEHPITESRVSLQFVDKTLQRYVLEVPASQLRALSQCISEAEKAIGLRSLEPPLTATSGKRRDDSM